MTETVTITFKPYAQEGRLPGVTMRLVSCDCEDMGIGEVAELEMTGRNLIAGPLLVGSSTGS